MDYFHAIFLGILQGLTEFLPISSSGHLLTVPKILNWQYFGKSFDVALHIGTFISLIIYYRETIVSLIKDFIESITHIKEIKTNPRYLLPWLIILASVPAGLVGLLLGDFLEKYFSGIIVTSASLIIFGILLGISETYGKGDMPLEKIDLKSAVNIGLSQILALIPGVSRSGITMTTGLFSGLSKAAAANFSFLISIPIVGAAAFYETAKMIMAPEQNASLLIFLVGIVSSGVSGYFVIKFLLDYIKKGSFQIFMYYRIIFGLLLLGLYFWGTIK